MSIILDMLFLAVYTAYGAWAINGAIYVYRRVVVLNWPSQRYVWAIRASTAVSLSVMAICLFFVWAGFAHRIVA